MNLIKLQKYRDSFEYFLYDLRNQKSKLTYAGTLINPDEFISEERIIQYLKFSSQFKTYHKLLLVDDVDRQVGYSTFLCFFAYYKCIVSPSDIFFISNSKFFKFYANTITEISLILKDILKVTTEVNNPTKEITFKSGGRIRFLSDVAYNFNGFTDKIDIIFFDTAALKNYDKLSFFLESILNDIIAEKVIMNFNLDENSESLTRLTEEFKNKIKLIKIKK